MSGSPGKTALQHAEDLQKKFVETKDPNDGRQSADAWCDLLSADLDNPIIMANLGAVLQELGMSGLACAVYNRALAIESRIPDAWSNLGGIYRNVSQRERAEQCFHQALMLKSERPTEYLNNLVTCYINSGRPQEGIAIADEGLAKDPDNYHLKWNKGLLLLELGQWDEGFALYENGLKLAERMRREYGEGIPMWDGHPFDDGYLVIYGEQGIGDEIMYASAIQDALKRCPKVILEVHPRLLSIFQHSFREVEYFYPTRKKDSIRWLGHHQDIKAKCAIGSLFNHFRRDGKFPQERYLSVDGNLMRKKMARIKELRKDGPVIGISWIGGSQKTNRDGRSVKISDLKPVFDAFPNGTFLSFQYTAEAKGKVERYREQHGINIHHLEEAYMEDYAHTAAMALCVDFVISPNTTLVHLCGSLGVKCFVFTPKDRAWRYYGEGPESDMPFYGPWVRQFHQQDNEPRLVDVLPRLVNAASQYHVGTNEPIEVPRIMRAIN